MGCYYTLCHNTYGYSLLFYKVYMKRENVGSWDSRLEKEQVLETYSAQLQKSRNSTKVIFRINSNYSSEEIPEGATHHPRGWGAHPTLLGTPSCLVGHLAALRCPLLYEVFYLGKNHKQAYGTKLRRHEVEPWRNQSRAPVEPFYRGNFPPGGGNHHHHHHQ